MANLVGPAPEHPELVGPLWRCLQAHGMTPDGFEELDAQPPLRRNGGDPNGLSAASADLLTAVPALMDERLIREAYPFVRGLPRGDELHPMVAVLCWAHLLKASPTPRNRYMEAKRQRDAFLGVERDWRRTSVAASFWIARIWSTVALLAAAVAWVALLTSAPAMRRTIEGDVWVWGLLGAVIAVVLYLLVTIPDSERSRTRRRRWHRLLDAGAAPQQGESGSVIPEISGRVLPESLAQIAVVLAPVLLAVPIYWRFPISGVAFGLVVFALAMLVVWIPALRAFDHGKRTLARNAYLDMYEDPDSVRWIMPRDRVERARTRQAMRRPAAAEHSGVDMRTWVRAAAPRMMYGGLLLAAVVWTLGYRQVPFDPSAVAFATGAVVLVVLVHAYTRFRHLESSAMLRLLLGMVGFVFVLTGLLFMGYGDERLAVRDPAGFGAAALFGGALVLYGALHLRTEFDQPTEIPRAIETGERSRDGMRAELQRFQASGSAGGIEREVGICLEKLALKDLHYVAYYVNGRIRFSIDLLDNDYLKTAFSDQPVRAQDRRHQYFNHGPRLFRLVNRFNEQFKTIESGDLLRVVLDVERGALYYFFVDTDRFLIGVTLDQNQVHETDRKLVKLVTDLRRAMGKLPIEELEGPVRYSTGQDNVMESV